jgi:ubiquinone/menaquinone biosynthesis C-methylase UbiE
MKIVNADTSLYGKLLKNKKIDFLEPAENFIRIFKQHLNKKKNMNCLDFGAGDGRHTRFLLERSHKVFATDISSQAMRLTKKNIPNFKNFIIFKNEEYSILYNLKKKFDLILCWETIHWLGNWNVIKEVLNIFCRLTKKNRHIIITFPAEDHYLLKNKRVGEFLFEIKNPERKKMKICAPNLKKLKNIFFNNKLKIEGIYKYSHGRSLHTKVPNGMISGSIKNMFSMYAFLLKKI